MRDIDALRTVRRALAAADAMAGLPQARRTAVVTLSLIHISSSRMVTEAGASTLTPATGFADGCQKLRPVTAAFLKCTACTCGVLARISASGAVSYTHLGEGYLKGMKVKKMPDNTINIANGRYTTCDAEDPHFYMAMTKSKTLSLIHICRCSGRCRSIARLRCR